MSENHDARRTAIGTPAAEVDDPDQAGEPDFAEPDFSDEHSGTTVGDDPGQADEGDLEPESPRGLGGMDTPPSPFREM